MSNESVHLPWRVNSVTGGHISDANGNSVCFCVGRDCAERARFIVDAVNKIDETKKLSIKLYDPIKRAEAERDRLRDALIEICGRVSVALNCPKEEYGGRLEVELLTHDLLGIKECARAAIGEEGQSK